MARILFHSPSVRPDREAPTGPALAAALMMDALAISRHAVERPVRFLLREPPGAEETLRARIAAAADCQADRVIRRHARARAQDRPQVWLTFRPRPETPDRIGERVGAALGLAHLLVATGADGGAAARGPAPAAAIAMGGRALDGLSGARPEPAFVRPFADLGRIHGLAKTRAHTRAALATRLQLPGGEPWLAAVLTGSPRAADSLKTLALALARIQGPGWRLIAILTGTEAAGALGPLSLLPRDRARAIGPVDRTGLLEALSAADAFAWPEVGEEEALALLQAQACGLAAVAGNTPEAKDIVVDGRTGRLAEPGNPASFANQLAFLLRQPAFLETYRKAAVETTLADHGLSKAADALDEAIGRLLRPDAAP